jgi:hypothetical protein
VLLLLLLTVTWLCLASGSILMTLTMWTLFDVVWFLARLIGGADGERVVWASALNGGASLILWAVSLLLLRDGDSGLWWLMRPSESVRALLLVAACLRIGFYPFQIVHAETVRRSRLHAFISILNPLMGIALLYRLVLLPEAYGLPAWAIGWGCLSMLWSGLKALSLHPQTASLRSGFGLLLAVVTGAVVASDGEMLLIGTGVWLGAMALILISRRLAWRDPAFHWSTLGSVALLLGAPVSPLHTSYVSVLTTAPWGWRVAYAIGLACLFTSLCRGLSQHSAGRVRPPWTRLTVSVLGGTLLIVAVLMVTAFRLPVGAGSGVAFALWLATLLVSVGLARWGRRVRATWRRSQPLVQFLDLQWLYRAIWQGAQNLLSVVRVTAEVVEGSGSVLWSVLVLLLLLLILGGG